MCRIESSSPAEPIEAFWTYYSKSNGKNINPHYHQYYSNKSCVINIYAIACTLRHVSISALRNRNSKRTQRAEMKTTTNRCELFFFRLQSKTIVRIFMQQKSEPRHNSVCWLDWLVRPLAARFKSNKMNNKKYSIEKQCTELNWVVADCFCPRASRRCVWFFKTSGEWSILLSAATVTET